MYKKYIEESSEIQKSVSDWLYSLNIESEPARRMVIIAGYVVGEPCKDVPEENVVKVTDVEPITGLNERQDLSNLLREKERRNIFSFW